MEKLSTKVSTEAVSEGLRSSLNVSEAIGVDKKKAPIIQGFDAIYRLMSSLGEVMTMDDIGLEQLNENVGGSVKHSSRETNGARAARLPNIQADAIAGHELQEIARLLDMCKQAVATLIDATPRDDAYTLETLGPILSDLRAAQESIESLSVPFDLTSATSKTNQGGT